MIKLHFLKKLNFSSGPSFLDINIQLSAGSFTAIYGPSGAGKTSILRMIAGLTDPDEGFLTIGNVSLFCKKTGVNIRPYNRKIGYVFQDYGLFPHMNVEDNLKYALENKIELPYIQYLLEIFEIDFLKRKDITQLSGGQKQRVSIARALVRRPQLLLMDEPFSSLDDETSVQLRQKILSIHQSEKITTVIVSHQRQEVISMCDHVFLIENGKIKSQGFPERLLGEGNIIIRGVVKGIINENARSFLQVMVEESICEIAVPIDVLKNFQIGETVQLEIQKTGTKYLK